MFTGIITDIGIIKDVEHRGDLRATIGCGYDMDGVDIGASISCNGVCLTVVSKTTNSFDVDISAETVGLTNVSAWDSGARINLERALKVGDELGGHMVLGHVDGVAIVADLREEDILWEQALRGREVEPEILKQIDELVS